jgi:hypothetical protein
VWQLDFSLDFSLGARQISSSARFCRINAAFQLPSERRIYAAEKISVGRPFSLMAKPGAQSGSTVNGREGTRIVRAKTPFKDSGFPV